MALLTSALRWVGIVIYQLGLHRLVYRWNGDALRVVVYHACAHEEDDFIRGLESNTTPEALERHLAFYRKHYRLVDLEGLSSPDRTLSITFDDGYRSVYDNALPILSRHSAPATVYLIANVVGSRKLVWVNELNWHLHRNHRMACCAVEAHFGPLPGKGAREVIVHVQRNFDRGRLDRVLTELRDSAGHDPELAESRHYLDWSEIEIMRERGITFGNHTASHPNLERLPSEEQRREILEAKETLARKLGAVSSLAYPFGYHDSTTRRIAAETGHHTVMEIGGTNRVFDPLRVRRVPVTNQTDAELFADIEVVEPLKSRWKHFRRRR